MIFPSILCTKKEKKNKTLNITISVTSATTLTSWLWSTVDAQCYHQCDISDVVVMEHRRRSMSPTVQHQRRRGHEAPRRRCSWTWRTFRPSACFTLLYGFMDKRFIFLCSRKFRNKKPTPQKQMHLLTSSSTWWKVRLSPSFANMKASRSGQSCAERSMHIPMVSGSSGGPLEPWT